MIIANKFLYGNKAASKERKCEILQILEVHAFNSILFEWKSRFAGSKTS